MVGSSFRFDFDFVGLAGAVDEAEKGVRRLDCLDGFLAMVVSSLRSWFAGVCIDGDSLSFQNFRTENPL